MLKKLLYLIFFIPGLSWAQPGFEVSANGILGLQSSELTILDSPVNDYQARGARGGMAFTYTFADSALEALLSIGVKRLYFDGSYAGHDFNGSHTKGILRLGGRYHFSESWAGGLLLTIENNKDFERKFRTGAPELWRYGLEVEGLYRLWPWLGITAAVNHPFYPNFKTYLLKNPGLQIMAGLNFNIW